MYHEIFLFLLALIWLFFGSIQDLRERIVSNWISLSLIIFSLGFRFFYSLFELDNFNFFYYGLLGLGIFFIIGNALYYGRFFAGGDAKLMIALGTVLPFSENMVENLNTTFIFIMCFLIIGMIYALVWSVFLISENFKDYKINFGKKLRKNKKIFILFAFLGIAGLFLGLIDPLLIYIGVIIFLIPYLYVFAKLVDEVCLVKKVKPINLEEGDWLYEKIKIGKTVIEPRWSGLTKNQIKNIKQKYKEVKIKQGIPFVPVFFFGMITFMYIYFSGLNFFN